MKKTINTLSVTCIMVTKLSHCYDVQTKWMHFLIKVDESLEKYNTIWIKTDIMKEFDSEPVYNKNYLKTKISCQLSYKCLQ